LDVAVTNTHAAVALTLAQSVAFEHSVVHVATTHVRPAAQPRRAWQQWVGSKPHAEVPGPGSDDWHPSVYSLSHWAPYAPPSEPPPSEPPVAAPSAVVPASPASAGA
jgi:hypothetical protein